MLKFYNWNQIEFDLNIILCALFRSWLHRSLCDVSFFSVRRTYNETEKIGGEKDRKFIMNLRLSTAVEARSTPFRDVIVVALCVNWN